jgi:hypothetical protein
VRGVAVRTVVAGLALVVAVGCLVASIVYQGMVGAGPTMVIAFQAWGMALLASGVAWRLAAGAGAGASPAWLRGSTALLFFGIAAVTVAFVAMVLVYRPPFG